MNKLTIENVNLLLPHISILSGGITAALRHGHASLKEGLGLLTNLDLAGIVGFFAMNGQRERDKTPFVMGRGR